jgi:hypothetical protein
MSALAFLRIDSQTPVCQVCVLVLATSTVAWCIKRRFLKTEDSAMASTGRNTTQSNAGLLSEPPATSRKRTYADVLKSTQLLGLNIQLQQSHGSPRTSPQPPRFQLKQSNVSLHTSPEAPHFQLSRDLVSAAHQVFRTPELLGMILVNLPLISDRSAMSVSKQFWAVLNPDAERHLCGIKGALGIDFSRSIESLTDSEKADLWGHKFTPLHILEPRLDWLVNFELDLAFACRRHAPFLKIWPFVFEGMTGSLKHRKLDISLRLDAEDIDKDYTESKGVYTPRKGRTMIYSNERDVPARNWMDVKLLNVPFRVLVSVAVDFRKCMGAPSHHEGTCRVPGCQVGLFGVQVRPALINLNDFSM